jgi:cytochrome oxidase Cu insertion factor (SCO1/SenC/PrrC family)
MSGPGVPDKGPLVEPGEATALAALGFLLAVTFAWWWMALVPVGASAPGWVETVRAVCFGAHDDGLPDAGGWILLIGEPIGMVAALAIGWGRPLESALRRLAARGVGRAILAGLALALLGGVGAAGWRVSDARGDQKVREDGSGWLPRAALSPLPPLALLDQFGDTLRLEQYRGRPVLVTFAYGHCETVCPTLVRNALDAQRRLHGAPAVVVVTLDPWRDSPSRLPSLAREWGIGARGHLLSGAVPEVARVLAAWGVQAARDPATGEITHLPLTFVIDSAGRSARATTGSAGELARAIGS